MPNKINISELFDDGGQIGKLKELVAAYTAELERLEKAQSKIAQSQGENSKSAQELINQMRAVNVVLAKDREALETGAKSADKLAKAHEALALASAENAIEIEEVRKETAELNRLNKLAAKIVGEQKDSYNALSAEYSFLVLQLNKMSKAQRQTTEEGKAMTKRALEVRDAMKEAKEETDDFRLSVGSYTKAIEKMGGPISGLIRDVRSLREGFLDQIKLLKSTTTGLTGGAKAWKIFKLAMAVSGIGLILVALGSLAAFLTKSQKGVDMLSDAMNAFGAVIDVVLDRAAFLGSALVKFFRGDFKGAMEDAKASVKGIGEELRNEIGLVVELGRTIRTLGRQQKELDVVTAQTRAQIKALNKDAEDTTKSYAVRAKAAKDAGELEEGLLKRRIYLIGQEIAAMKEKADTSNSLDADLEEIQAKEIEFANLKSESLELQTTIQNKLNSIRKAASEEEIKRLEEQRKNQEAMNALLKKSIEDGYTPADQAVQRLNESLNEYNELIAKGAKASPKFVEDIGRQFDEVARRAEEGLTKAVPAIEEAGVRTYRKFLEGVAKGIETIPPQEIIDTRTFWEKLTDGFDEFADNNQDIYDLLGFTLDDSKKQALNDALNTAKDFIGQLLDARVEAADRAVEVENNRVEQLQQAYQTERDAEQAGLANRADTVKKELDIATKAQRAALKEQERAVRAQNRLQTLEQSVNLVTATTKIWSSFAGFGPAGPALALGAIALMWGTFIANKIRAASLTKKEFKKGGLEILEGGTHASGDDTYLGFHTKKGEAAYGERGEAHAIIPASATRKYRTVLPEIVESLRKETFERKFQRVNADHVPDANIIIQGGSNGGTSIDLSRVEGDLKAIRKRSEIHREFDQNGKLKYEERPGLRTHYV